MVSRIYVEKKPGFDVEAQQLKGELTEILGIKGIEALRIINRYDVEGIDEELFRSCVPTVFSEPQVDVTYDELPASDGAVFAVEFLPGQFDQRADSASECVQLDQPGRAPHRALRQGLHDLGRSGRSRHRRHQALRGQPRRGARGLARPARDVAH